MWAAVVRRKTMSRPKKNYLLIGVLHTSQTSGNFCAYSWHLQPPRSINKFYLCLACFLLIIRLFVPYQRLSRRVFPFLITIKIVRIFILLSSSSWNTFYSESLVKPSLSTGCSIYNSFFVEIWRSDVVEPLLYVLSQVHQLASLISCNVYIAFCPLKFYVF